VQRVAFEGFSLVLPDGWSDVLDDATYSDTYADAEQLPPQAFASDRGPGMLYVSSPLLDPTDVPAADPAELEDLARDWGARRGIAAPLTCAGAVRPHGAIAAATYRLGPDFVAVWFISNGISVLCASYVCPWSERDAERDVRDAIAESLRFT